MNAQQQAENQGQEQQQAAENQQGVDLENDMSRIRLVDIVCDTTINAVTHPGNRDYAVALSTYIATHPQLDLSNVEQRGEASRTIVQTFRNQGVRFLGRTRRETWKELSERLAIRWVAHHLRRVGEFRDEHLHQQILQQQQQLDINPLPEDEEQ